MVAEIKNKLDFSNKLCLCLDYDNIQNAIENCKKTCGHYDKCDIVFQAEFCKKRKDNKNI